MKFIDIDMTILDTGRGVKCRRLNVETIAMYDVRECYPGTFVVDIYTAIEADRGIQCAPVRTLTGDEMERFMNAVALPNDRPSLPKLSDDQFPLTANSNATGSFLFDSKGKLVGRVLKNPSAREFHTVNAVLLGVDLGEFNSVKAAEDYLLKCANAAKEKGQS